MKPIIKKVSGKPYTKVTWTTDFKRFNIDGLNDEIVSLFERRIYDIYKE